MKKALSIILAAVMMLAVLPMGAAAAEVETEDIQPRTSYDHPIPDFVLVADEQAFTTRWGYGFTISDDGKNHNDIDLAFAVNGAAVNLRISVLTMESYSNGNYDVVVKSETVTSAGSKNISFNNLSQGTYVIMWKNIGSKQVDITGARLTTSY